MAASVWSMVYDRDDETNWLLKLQNNSRERIHSARMGFWWNPPIAQQKAEASANFSVMKTIARKRNPKSVSVLSELERLCMNALDGKISEKEFLNRCKRVAKNARISNPIVDFLDDLILNQSDIYPNRNQANKTVESIVPNNPFMNLKNQAFEKPKNFRTKPLTKNKDIFGYNPAFDYGGHKNKFGLGVKNPALDGNWETKGKMSQQKMLKNSTLREPMNPFTKLKNPFLTSQPKNVNQKVSSSRNSARAQFDPWALRNPAFADLKKSKKNNKKNPFGGFLKW